MNTITPMYSDKGYKVEYQCIHEDESSRMFVSYGTNIALLTNQNVLYIDENKWDYSRTTIKYLCKFLGFRHSRFHIERLLDPVTECPDYPEVEELDLASVDTHGGCLK